MTEGRYSTRINEPNQQNSLDLYMSEKSRGSPEEGQANWAYQHDMAESESDTGFDGDDSITPESQHGTEEKGRTCGLTTHSIILDISTTSFVDTVSVKTLKNVCVLINAK